MSHFLKLLKINAKLLLRNKGFLFFLLAAPLLSVVILNLHMDTSFYDEDKETGTVRELDSPKERIVYLNDIENFSVKVYDASHSKLTGYILQDLAGNGMYSVYRLDAEKMSENQVRKYAEQDAKNDRVGVILYLKPGFFKDVVSENAEDGFLIYEVSDDARMELFLNDLKDEICAVRQVAEGTGGDETAVLSTLRAIQNNLPEKKIVTLNGKNTSALNTEQNTKKGLAGYAYAVLTLGFLFCGVCIAHTVIEERDNGVYTRIMLTKAGQAEYLLAKLCMCILIALLQTGVMAGALFGVRDMNFGVSKAGFLSFIFLLGLIFSVISLCVGILIGNVMGANYAVFAVWSISAMLAGLYFPLDGTSEVMEQLSHLMPQWWFLKGTEMLLLGNAKAYPMICCITAAYLIVILGIGAVGLKLKASEA